MLCGLSKEYQLNDVPSVAIMNDLAMLPDLLQARLWLSHNLLGILLGWRGHHILVFAASSSLARGAPAILGIEGLDCQV